MIGFELETYGSRDRPATNSSTLFSTQSFLHPSIYPPTHPSIHQFIYQSIQLHSFINLSTHPPIVQIHLSMHLTTRCLTCLRMMRGPNLEFPNFKQQNNKVLQNFYKTTTSTTTTTTTTTMTTTTMTTTTTTTTTTTAATTTCR